MDAGPVDPTLLYLQDRHRSRTCVEDIRPLDCVYHFKQVRQFSIEDDRVQLQLARAGFLHLSRLDYVRLDRPLLTCLIERWRPETCTFHMRLGEMTITLQDVAVILGLRIDGPPVIARLDREWRQLCMELLGRAPESMSGGLVTLDWLRSSFQLPGPDASDIEIEQLTRGYILHHIGATLFPDASRTSVHCKWLVLLEDLDVCGTLSWGSAVLAHLYSEMSAASLRERSLFCGCAALIQMWSWTRLAVGSPSLGPSAVDPLAPFGIRYNCARSWDTGPDRSIRFYRDQFDMLDERAVMWVPYPGHLLEGLLEICRATSEIWCARTHIICFSTVSFHHLDRVLRQFGMTQHIPDPPTQVAHVSIYPWRLVASVKKKLLHSNYFTITKYIPQHTCQNPGTALENRQVTSKWICQLILPIMRKRLDMTPAIIQDHIKLAWQRDISYYKAWDARRKTLIHLFGDWETSYHTLQQYMEAIVMRNPGTVYKITSENLVGGEHAMFTGFFWAFGPCIEGFRHCRPVLSIDGTHLYGKYPGCLLVATGVDADGGLYPLAFAIVDSETRDNWEWFFHCLRVYIPSVAHRQITFISDRMKGLPTALARGWQQPHHHRYCMRHIKANFKLKFKDESLQNLLYNAGRASELKDYESIRQSLKEKCPAADEWINLSLKPENEE